MKKEIILLLSVIILAGCTSKDVKLSEPASRNYTYEGFYDGMSLDKNEQDALDAGSLHISQTYLLPTVEYSHSVYPLKGTTENDYITRHKDEIIQFVEEQFYNEYKIEINVRDDRMFDYIEVIENDNLKARMYTGEQDKVEKALIAMRYDVLAIPEYPNNKFNLGINYNLLMSKNTGDGFDSSILIPYYEGKWFNDSVVMRDIISVYYSRILNTYSSETIKIVNDYFILSDNYYVPTNRDVCPYSIWAMHCRKEGAVSLAVSNSSEFKEYFEEHGTDPAGFLRGDDLYRYFIDNDMSVEEIVEYINVNVYYDFEYFVEIFISKDLFDEYGFSKLGKDEKQLNNNFTNDNLSWIIRDKDNIKDLIKNSDTPFAVNYSVGYGLRKFDDNADESFFGKYNIYLPMRIYDGDYPWLIDDIERENNYGTASGFSWEGE